MPLNDITSFYGSSCANNSKGALNTPETLPLRVSQCVPGHQLGVGVPGVLKLGDGGPHAAHAGGLGQQPGGGSLSPRRRRRRRRRPSQGGKRDGHR
eukprot:1189521-Prorocentrum_minimum.AAC.2